MFLTYKGEGAQVKASTDIKFPVKTFVGLYLLSYELEKL